MEYIFSEYSPTFPWLKFNAIKNLLISRARVMITAQFKLDSIKEKIVLLDEFFKNSDIPTDIESRYKRILNADLKSATKATGCEFFVQVEIDLLKSKKDAITLNETRASDDFLVTLKDLITTTGMNPNLDSDQWITTCETQLTRMLKDIGIHFQLDFKIKQDKDKKKKEEKKKKFEEKKAADEKELVLTEGELRKRLSALLLTSSRKPRNGPRKNKNTVPNKPANKTKGKSGNGRGRKPARVSGQVQQRAASKLRGKDRRSPPRKGTSSKKSRQN